MSPNVVYNLVACTVSVSGHWQQGAKLDDYFDPSDEAEPYPASWAYLKKSESSQTPQDPVPAPAPAAPQQTSTRSREEDANSDPPSTRRRLESLDHELDTSVEAEMEWDSHFN